MSAVPLALCHNDDPADWLTLDQAAALIGEPARTLRYRASSRWAATGLARLYSPPGGGKPIWWLHRSCHPALARPAKPRETAVTESLLARFPARHVDRACRKMRWVDRWRELCAAPRRDIDRTDSDLARLVVREAKEVEGDSFRISVRSLQAWWHAAKSLGPDRRPLGAAALVGAYRGPARASELSVRSPEAIDYFYSLYRTHSRRSVAVCHAATLRASHRAGWSWPRDYSATTRWLRDCDDLALTCLMREGRGAWSRRYMPHLEMDWAAVEPGEMYVCDHTQCDFWCLYGDRQVRPWLTAVQDCRSRCIVGWHLGPAPHSDAVARSLLAAYRDWAIPSVMRIDNGKDYTSRYITGVSKSEARALRRALGSDWKRIIRRDLHLVAYDERWLGITGELGVQLIYAIPYAPWSKGTLERFFRTFEDQCAKDFVTYCGNSPFTRPGCLDELRGGRVASRSRGLHLRPPSDCPTLEQAREAVARYVELYHGTPHKGVGVDGSTPLGVWRSASGLRRADDDALVFLMQVRGAYTVGRNGVSLTVGGARLTYTAAPLNRLKGRKVLIAVDPTSVDHCWALDCRSRQLITRCQAVRRIHPHASVDDVRSAVAASQRDKSVMHKAARAAASRTRTMAQRITAANRERLLELRTGTDAVDLVPNIRPVRTGFEAASSCRRDAGCAASFSASDPGEIADLLEEEAPCPVEADDDDLADLLEEEAPCPVEADDDLADLLEEEEGAPGTFEPDDGAELECLFAESPPVADDDGLDDLL